ncbi:hypothetical protein ACJJTC_018906 [Scirpophaga incertulas]
MPCLIHHIRDLYGSRKAGLVRPILINLYDSRKVGLVRPILINLDGIWKVGQVRPILIIPSSWKVGPVRPILIIPSSWKVGPVRPIHAKYDYQRVERAQYARAKFSFYSQSLTCVKPATAPPSSSRRTIAAEKPRTVAATTTPTPTTTTQPQDTGRAPYAAIAGSSREPTARDPRPKTRMDDHQEKCFDTDHRLLVKTPETKQPILQQRPAKRQQEEDETTNTRATKQKLEASVQVVAPPKEQRLRKPKRLRSAGADITTHPEPSEVPVVAASSQRTKAKPATSDQAPTASEGTAAEILGKLIQVIQGAFVSAMSGESLTTDDRREETYSPPLSDHQMSSAEAQT